MIVIRKSDERGQTDLGWLKSMHTFSFGFYRSSEHRGFETLRVINDDWVEPGEGFATHSHDNMEIISYVLEGALEHKDSMGNGSVIRPGEIQRMSAGSGVTHSEYNHSNDEKLHFLQIWFRPNVRDIEPSYEQREFVAADKRGRFCLVASSDGRDQSLRLHQDVAMSVALIDGDERVAYTLKSNRAAWVHVVTGRVMMNGMSLCTGDGASVTNTDELLFEGGEACEVIVFDMSVTA